MKDLIDWINKTDLCTGCGLCESVAGSDSLKVQLNPQGFLRPVAERPFAEDADHEIKQICPGIVLKNNTSVPNYDTTWGPLVRLRTGFSTDNKVRFESSSGGAISAVLIHLLQTKKVNGVIHIGRSKGNSIHNEVKLSRTADEVAENAGSRYCPSAPLAVIHGLLEEEGRFALVGKPCDIAALRSYAKLRPEVNEKIPYQISFFCGGIPSVEGTKKILEMLQVTENELSEFRYRGQGWPGSTKAVLKGGDVKEMSYEDSWGRILNRHLQLRCKICPDSIGESADIVCGDAWYEDEKGEVDFREREGRSIVISRTEKGEALIEQCIADGELCAEELSTEQLGKMQPSQRRRKQLVFSRLVAMKLLFMSTPRYSLAYLTKISFSAGLRANVKSFAGMFVRVLAIRLTRIRRDRG